VASFTGATTQDGRIFRDGIASTCPVKAYPGIFGEGTLFNYETFTYNNTGAAAACVTVNFDPDTVGTTPCTTNAHMSAYQGSYDPANQSANFLGDVGSSLAQPFSFEVAANSQMVLVVTNTASAAVCDFGFEVIDLPCDAGGGGVPLGPQIELPTQNTLGMLIMGLLLAAAGWLAVRRRT
jgi:LPXTG-motif cell wall-anchored protein